MVLELNFKNRNIVELILKNGSKVIDRGEFEFDRNLETVLISGLDKILNRNTMLLSSLKMVKIAKSISRDSLSYQIIRSFKKALDL